MKLITDNDDNHSNHRKTARAPQERASDHRRQRLAQDRGGRAQAAGEGGLGQ